MYSNLLAGFAFALHMHELIISSPRKGIAVVFLSFSAITLSNITQPNTKMYGFRNLEPTNRFSKTVYVTRNFVQDREYDVKIVYHSKGRGVFEVEGGKIISDEKVKGGRRLKIKINQMEKYFHITRARGEYSLSRIRYRRRRTRILLGRLTTYISHS